MPSASAPAELRFEHWPAGEPALGIGVATPRLSWIVPSADPGFAQTRYQAEFVRGGAPAETVTVESADQVLVPWPVEKLTSRERATVRVRVGDGDRWSPWSEPAVVEPGLLETTQWSAQFISPRSLGGLDMPAPVLHGTIDIPDEVVSARLYVTAHGVYLPFLNGARVDDHQLAPGWTSYRHRLRYQTFDVTDLVKPGANELSIMLGNGWYRGRLGFRAQRAIYGDRLALLAQLEVTTADGSVHVLGSDGSWTATEGAVLADDLYDGQSTDLRRSFLSEGPADAVEVLSEDLGRLVAPEGPPVRVLQTVPAVELLPSSSGATIIDFGQNLVGWVRLRVRGRQPGDEVVLRHAEVLEHGELGVRPLRTAKATDSYLLSGGEETLEPQLTFHGFRFAEITGIGGLQLDQVEAVVVGSDLRRTGWFESSEPMLNRFHDNVVWGARGNFVDIPTDCPQRDERLGWTGDISVFSPTASYLFDVAGFLSSWLAELAVDQRADGTVPVVIPDILPSTLPAMTGWGDASVVVPSVLHERFGDVGILARQLPSMQAWIDRIAAIAGPSHRWTGGRQFGDWLDPSAPPEEPAAAKADADVVATAYYARSTELVAAAAELVGEADVAARYGKLAEDIGTAFRDEYVTPEGRVLSDAQTVYALALAFGLFATDAQRDGAARRLADLVRSADFRIGTGFLGTPLVTDALTSSGDTDLAYRLMLQRGCPSWLYSVTMGATTVWERWDSLLPDGTINPGEMTSFNHYALGAVADWLHRTVAGLAPAAPGYREILVRPLPGPILTSASARHRTPYGEAATSWVRADGRFHLDLTVPVGASATVHLPGEQAPHIVGHGRHQWDVADPAATGERNPPSTVRDVVDDQPLWDEVVDAVVTAGRATDGAVIGARVARFLDHPIADLTEALSAWDSFEPSPELTKRLEALLQNAGVPEDHNAS